MRKSHSFVTFLVALATIFVVACGKKSSRGQMPAPAPVAPSTPAPTTASGAQPEQNPYTDSFPNASKEIRSHLDQIKNLRKQNCTAGEQIKSFNVAANSGDAVSTPFFYRHQTRENSEKTIIFFPPSLVEDFLPLRESGFKKTHHFNILSFDYRGLGCNSRPEFAPANISSEKILEDVRSLIQHLNLNPKDLIFWGAGFGSIMAQKLAMEYETAQTPVSALVVESPIQYQDDNSRLSQHQTLWSEIKEFAKDGLSKKTPTVHSYDIPLINFKLFWGGEVRFGEKLQYTDQQWGIFVQSELQKGFESNIINLLKNYNSANWNKNSTEQLKSQIQQAYTKAHFLDDQIRFRNTIMCRELVDNIGGNLSDIIVQSHQGAESNVLLIGSYEHCNKFLSEHKLTRSPFELSSIHLEKTTTLLVVGSRDPNLNKDEIDTENYKNLVYLNILGGGHIPLLGGHQNTCTDKLIQKLVAAPLDEDSISELLFSKTCFPSRKNGDDTIFLRITGN